MEREQQCLKLLCTTVLWAGKVLKTVFSSFSQNRIWNLNGNESEYMCLCVCLGNKTHTFTYNVSQTQEDKQCIFSLIYQSQSI